MLFGLELVLTNSDSMFNKQQKRHEFETSMLEMSNDPEVLRECAVIENEFTQTEMDGLDTDMDELNNK